MTHDGVIQAELPFDEGIYTFDEASFQELKARLMDTETFNLPRFDFKNDSRYLLEITAFLNGCGGFKASCPGPHRSEKHGQKRERSKIIARRARVKKRAEFEWLRDQLELLVTENVQLRQMASEMAPVLYSSMISVLLPRPVVWGTNLSLFPSIEKLEEELQVNAKLTRYSLATPSVSRAIPIEYSPR